MIELIGLFWIADILNLPFMEMFDTTYPLNGLFWFLGWFFIAMINSSRNSNTKKEN